MVFPDKISDMLVQAECIRQPLQQQHHQQQPLHHLAAEPMQVDAPLHVGPIMLDNENANNEDTSMSAAAAAAASAYIVENPSLDLEVYANSYVGLARLYRLIYIVNHCPSLRLEALKLAISYVMTTYNINLYTFLHQKLAESLGGVGGGGQLPDVAMATEQQQQQQPPQSAQQDRDIPVLDSMWIESRNKKAALKLEKLDNDLKNYKSNSIKESIRRGHDDLGDHYLDCGDLSNALKCYSRARDYCTSGKHVVNMCLNVIKVSVYLQNWSHVLSYVGKAEATPSGGGGGAVSAAEGSSGGGGNNANNGGGGGGGSGSSSSNATSGGSASLTNLAVATKLKAAAGLAVLATGKYKLAAKHFLLASLDHCDPPTANDLVSPSNIAVYGGLCALATFSRAELHAQLIYSTTFKLFLELEPQLRDVIVRFYESKYAQSLRLLDGMRDNLLLDMYLAPHVKPLYALIRSRALVQYFSPYLSADMRRMAHAFSRTVEELEEEVVGLILDGQIQARIDSHNKVLFAKDVDQRRTTFERSLLMGKEYQRRTRMLILRAAVLRTKVHVKSPQRGAAAAAASSAAAAAAAAENNQTTAGGHNAVQQQVTSVDVATGAAAATSDATQAATTTATATATTAASAASSLGCGGVTPTLHRN